MAAVQPPVSDEAFVSALRSIASKANQFAASGYGQTRSAPAQSSRYTPPLTPAQREQVKLSDLLVRADRMGLSFAEREALLKAQSGESAGGNPLWRKVLGNPITQTALKPLMLADTGRRASVSGVRELVDILDSDPTTRASFGDWLNQTKDFAYGFGTAFPMKGWRGRLVGLVGDIALDPLTYATFGSTVPASALIKGTNVSTRAALGLEKQALFGLKFGGKKVIGADARARLGALAGKQMRRANLVDDAERAALGLTKRTEEQIMAIERQVAARGKIALPSDVAEVLGMPKAGVYWFGSRVKLPFSGPLARGLESVMVGGRIAINTKLGAPVEKLMRALTPEGTAGTKIGAKEIGDMRRALATGKISDADASAYLKILGAEQNRRVVYNLTGEEMSRTVNSLLQDPNVQASRGTVYELLENPSAERLARATPGEVAAANKVRQHFDSAYRQIEGALKAVDPQFQMGRIENYFPHVATEKALRYVDNLNNPFVEQLRKYLKRNVSDPAASFRSRNIQSGMDWFGHTLTESDIAQGVKRLNEIARDPQFGGLKFDFFETDIEKVLKRYTYSFSEEMAGAQFLGELARDGSVLRMLEAKGAYSDDALDALDAAVEVATKNVGEAITDVRQAALDLRRVIDDRLKVARRGAVENVGSARRGLVTDASLGKQGVSIAKTRESIATLRQRLLQIDLQSKEKALKQFGLSGPIVDGVLTPSVRDITDELNVLLERIGKFEADVAVGRKSLADTDEYLAELDKSAQRLARRAEKAADTFNNMRDVHNEIADYINGRFSKLLLGDAAAKELPVTDAVKRVLDVVQDRGVRDRVVLGRGGKLRQNTVRASWGKSTAEVNPDVARFKQLLDPANRVKESRLRQLRIEDVREIISRAQAGAGSLQELHDALVWLTVREVDFDPSLIGAFLKGVEEGPSTGAVTSLLDASGSVRRFQNIRQTVEEINRLNSVIDDMSRPLGTGPTPKGGIRYGAEQLSDFRSRITDIDNEIREVSERLFEMGSLGELDGFKEFASVARAKTGVRIDPAGEDFQTLISSLRAYGLDDDADFLVRTIGESPTKPTYGELKAFVEDKVSDVAPKAGPRDSMREHLAELTKEKTALEEQVSKKAQSVDKDLRREASVLLDGGDYAEKILDISDKALEYYLYSETKVVMNSLMAELAPYGITPSYGIYQRVLADVAHRHVAELDEFGTKFASAVDAINNMKTEVSGLAAGDQSTRLRELIVRELEGPNGPVLDEIFPEFRAAVSTTKISELTRMEVHDPVMSGYRSEILALLKKIGEQRIATPRAPARAGVLQTPGQGLARGSVNRRQLLSLEAVVAKLQSAPKNINTVNLIDDTIAVIKDLPTLGVERISEAADDSVRVGLLQQLDLYKQQAIARREVLKAERAAAIEAQKRITGKKVNVATAGGAVRARRQLAKAGFNYGLSGSLEAALGARTTTNIRRFFGNIVGDSWVYNPSNADKYRYVISGARQEKNQARRFTYIPRSESYAGRVEARLSARKAALRGTQQADYPVERLGSTGSVLPSLTDPNLHVYGPSMYADMLTDWANSLMDGIRSSREFTAQLEQAQKAVVAAGVDPSDPQLMVETLRRLRAERGEMRATGLFGISDMVDISSLPPSVQADVFKARQLKLKAARIAEDPLFLAAQNERKMFDMLTVLSDIDGWRLVGANGEPGFFFEPSGIRGKHIWNAPRIDSPTIGGTVVSNEDSLRINRWLQQQPNGGRWGYLRSSRSTHDVYALEQVAFDSSKVSREAIYLVQDRAVSFDEAVSAAANGAEVVMLKPIRERRVVGVPFSIENARINNGDEYLLEQAWVRLPEEGQRVVTDPSNPAYGTVAVAGRPEAWVPLTEIYGVRSATPMENIAFTGGEWESLFNPEAAAFGRIPNLRREIAARTDELKRLGQQNPRGARGASAAQYEAWNKKYNALAARLDQSRRELETIRAHQTARVKAQRLMEYFSSADTARLLGMDVGGRAAADPVEVAKKFVRTQAKGVDENGSTVIAPSITKGSRKRAISRNWADSELKDVLDQYQEVQVGINELLFGKWANSLTQQYEAYVNAVEQLGEMRMALGASTGGISKSVDESAAASLHTRAKMLVDFIDRRPVKKTDVVNPAPALTEVDEVGALRQEVSDLIAKGDADSLQQAVRLIEERRVQGEQLVGEALGVAEQMRQVEPPPAVALADNAQELLADTRQTAIEAAADAADVRRQIEDMMLGKAAKQHGVAGLEEAIAGLTKAQQTKLAEKAKRLEEIARINKAIERVFPSAEAKGARANAVSRIDALERTMESQTAAYDNAVHMRNYTEARLAGAEAWLNKLEAVADESGVLVPTKKGAEKTDWIAEFNEWKDEAIGILEILRNHKGLDKKTARVLSAYVDSVNMLESTKSSLSSAQSAVAAERGIKMMFEESGGKLGANTVLKQLEEGFVYLNEARFPNVQVKARYAEIFQNAHILRDPLQSTRFGQFMRRYNSYWKPLATTTPGFHVRNNTGNAFAMLFGGGKPLNLREGLEVSIKWHQAGKQGLSWEEFLRTLPAEQAARADGARWAVAATGTGAFDEVQEADNVVQRLGLVKASRKFGTLSDQHARFIFSYDAMAQGFEKELAAARTKRFFVDYEDISQVDKMMRQIVPFWMWSSRNVVTQVQNMWMNPKPYQIYMSIRRNIRDDEPSNPEIPSYWRELGAFKLPFGRDLYAMPDLGFNRIEQQLSLAQEPSRLLGDVSPVLRLPLEMFARKQFYSGAPVPQEVPVSGFGPGSVLQPLAQALGEGRTGSEGTRYIDPMILNVVRNMLPPVSVAERLTPSTGVEAGSLSLNALLGLFGIPVKQQTEEGKRKAAAAATAQTRELLQKFAAQRKNP